jgi:hypothetical protein
VLGFLKSIWGVFTGGLSDVWHYILTLVSAIYSYIDKVYQQVSGNIVSVYHQLLTFSKQVGQWVTHEVSNLTNLIDFLVNRLYKWALTAIADLDNYAKDLYRWAFNEFHTVSNWVLGIIDQVRRWVLNDIWNPLYRDVSGAIGWITSKGAYVYDLLTHPDKLVALLAAYLLKAWLSILRTWGKPIARFILLQGKSLIPDLVSVIEDIIHSVL